MNFKIRYRTKVGGECEGRENHNNAIESPVSRRASLPRAPPKQGHNASSYTHTHVRSMYVIVVGAALPPNLTVVIHFATPTTMTNYAHALTWLMNPLHSTKKIEIVCALCVVVIYISTYIQKIRDTTENLPLVEFSKRVHPN